MPSYGQNAIGTTGAPIQVSADGRTDGFKHAGVTIDWDTVTAVSADTTLSDGTIVKDGDKYLRFGTILDLIGTAEVQTIDLSGDGDPTGGTWSITYAGQTTGALAYDASAAAVQAALEALSNIEQGDVVVTKASFVYTLTWASNLGNVAEVTATDIDLTTATTIDITIATGTAGTGNGKHGPADTSEDDGRQTLARGESYILNRTVVESHLGSDHPPVLESGTVYKARLLTNENAPGLNNPTYANVLTAFPGIRIVGDI